MSNAVHTALLQFFQYYVASTNYSKLHQLLILCLISLLFSKFKTALINHCDLLKIVFTERGQRQSLCWFMMLLFPPSETSSTIDICMVEGKPTCVGRVYTGGDVCHEGASFWSHYASYKLMLRGILSFLLSFSAALFWRPLSDYFSSTNIIPSLPIAHLFIHCCLLPFMLLWRIWPYFQSVSVQPSALVQDCRRDIRKPFCTSAHVIGY